MASTWDGPKVCWVCRICQDLVVQLCNIQLCNNPSVSQGMGFNDQEIVALSGAHGLGACHTDRSGFWGPWTRAPTTVSNEYYRELLENTWTIKTTHKGQPWKGPLQFEDPTGDLMMLPSDMVLIQDKSFRKYVEMYAKDDSRFQKDFAQVVGKLFGLGCQESKRFGFF
eukprot:symbB.v1.2.040109.t1/scaffold6997.1/size13990/2